MIVPSVSFDLLARFLCLLKIDFDIGWFVFDEEDQARIPIRDKFSLLFYSVELKDSLP